ncbi:MAG: AAA family ATPase [Gemmatimonadales bacterium]|nr:AAA family ATPase [Gemmatimonadales bacterium]
MERRFEPETLIGREREFSFLYDAWLDARRKRPRIVVVTSDPGVGKTTLANAFVSSCQMDGAVVARAQAYDAERELPFAVLGELVRQLASQRAIGSADPEALSELTRISSEILRVFPGVPKPVEWSPELTPLRIADAFWKTVTAAAEECPVVLIVDDIHAADNASAAILHVVARKLADVRVMMILAGRTSELRLSGAPAAFTGDTSIAGIRGLELDVLDSSAAVRLVSKLVASTEGVDPPTERILRASGGNPLAIELLAKEWSAQGPTSLLSDLEALDTQPHPTIGIPRAIGAVFERQSRRLDLDTRAALDLAAVLGRRLSDVELYRAVELFPGGASEALSRLKEEGLLREIGGDLEFRNELIRAQAYYSIAGPARAHLHRRVATILSARTGPGALSRKLEIAWHFLRGGNVAPAVPFALDGAEASLAVGAPHAAEEALSALVGFDHSATNQRRIRLLLAKALIGQSKAEPALPIMDDLASDPSLTVYENAEVAMMRAAAEFALNSEPGLKYCEAAKSALASATRAGNPELIARALFECARAGTEEGLVELVQIARDGITQLARENDLSALPMAVLTRSFCQVFYLDPKGALHFLNQVAEISRDVNAAQMSFIYSGIGLASLHLCRLPEAFEGFRTALEFSRKVGDDARTSLLASNLCNVQVARGEYENAVEYGKLARSLGESSSSSLLQHAYTNLVDAYVLLGREDLAVECMTRARDWLEPRRRWKLHCSFLMESAAFALLRGNTALALDLAGQVESMAQGREAAVPMIGSYWKLRIFRTAHVHGEDAAFTIAEEATQRLRGNCPYLYLDVLAAKTWLEARSLGRPGPQTMQELAFFDEAGAVGRKALLTLQGFLRTMPSPVLRDEVASVSWKSIPK